MKLVLGPRFFFVSLWSFIWFSGVVDAGGQVPAQREGDPPRIGAHDLYEYRHMQRTLQSVSQFVLGSYTLSV